MTAEAPSVPPYQPSRPAVLALAVFVAAGLTLLWPILTGHFLAGPDSDQYVAGYGFRLFGAQYFREHGAIPLWNPFLFGGLPFVGAMHGDVFYPTAWVRWVLPTDLAMNLGFAFHIVLAGATMYALLRALQTSWGGAVAGGLAWELSGIVAGLVYPGHDGKLFVAALTPLLFLGLLRAVRDQRPSAYGVVALTVGLSLHGHPQLSYYLLVAAALWGAWLVWLSPWRPPRARAVRVVAAAVGAVALGFGLYAVQALPFYEYIPYSPRAAEGSSGGWDYATAYSLPLSELFSLVIPEFNGLKEMYWGVNPLKHHTEYVGLLPLALAALGLTDRRRRPVVAALGAIGVLFLLVAFGRHTPFYRAWYEVMPLMQKVRAPGMAFFLVAFPLSVFAGFGADRLLAGEVRWRRAVVVPALLAGLGLLGVMGILQAVAQAIALPDRMPIVLANEGNLRAGGLRVLALGLAAAALLAVVARGRLRGALAALALAALVAADLYSIERKFFVYQAGAAVTYADDEVTHAIREAPLPYRVLDAGVYRGSWLMAHQIPALLGYHGNELRFFDDLLGGKNSWQNLGHPRIWDLYAVRFLLTDAQLRDAPGWHMRLGPVPVAGGGTAFLYESEAPPAWARVVPAAVRIPEPQIIPTLLDPRFPADRVVLLPDTVGHAPATLGDTVPGPSAVRAELTAWEPGRMTVRLEGKDPGLAYLVVGENWYTGWTAQVDGAEAPVLRGQYALITVPLPSGAREVELVFRSPAYRRGLWISLASLVVALGLVIVPSVRGRRHG